MTTSLHRRRLIALAAACPLALLLPGCREEVATIGQPAPELAALDLQGAPARLAQWRGRAVYLTFWSSGCAACLVEMPHLEALSRQYQGRVEVVGINVDPDGVAIDRALARLHVSFPMVRDSMGMTRERYRVEGTPTSFVIDSAGILQQSLRGAPPAERLEEIFREAAQTHATAPAN